MKKFISIDFEDFSHDLKRSLGIWETGPLREKALWESYKEINDFLSQIGGSEKGSKATFFCTAVIAKELPELIKEISSDGHEIGCHYYFHDDMDKQNIYEVESMLGKAKDELESAAESEVIGFRAPKFKINQATPEQYLAVERFFEYDSSLSVNQPIEIESFIKKMGLRELKILPVFWEDFMGQKMKLGGSFMKLFPESFSRHLMLQANKNGLNPHIYLHPYEFNDLQNFKVSMKELKSLGFFKSTYWSLRQNQWHKVGNKSLKHKVSNLIGKEGLGGTLKENFLN